MPSEQLICGDRLLVWLDRALSENYRAMLAADLEKDAKRELMKSQHRWLAERSRCTTIECLSTKYRDRIDGVCMYAGRGGMRVNCKSSEDVLVEMQYRTRPAG